MREIDWDIYTIEIREDTDFVIDATDNLHHYTSLYLGEGANVYKGTQYGIHVWQEDVEVSSTIIIGTGGATTIVSEKSVLLDQECLLICCGDSLFSLKLPSLKLNWKKKLDFATCFGVYHLEADFLVHGEVELTRIDRRGNVKWQFSAKDIFVSLNGDSRPRILDNHIEIKDWDGTTYLIGFDGALFDRK